VISPFGLCSACAHQRLVGNTRGSRFSLCGLARADARFPKYPRMPVLRCDGFDRREIQDDSAAPDDGPARAARVEASAGVEAPAHLEAPAHVEAPAHLEAPAPVDAPAGHPDGRPPAAPERRS
jgi:hypothetical protein